MRKNIFIMSFVFFANLFFSCSFFEETEEITFYFPDSSTEITTLCKTEFSHWQIKIQNSEETFFYEMNENKITIKTKKNEPLSVLAFPITKLSDENLCQFFKPCGTIYPYDFNYNDSSQTLTWENGFCATIINQLFESQKESNFSSSQINEFIRSFNWQKMMQTILEKIAENSQEIEMSQSQNFFNPWQIDISNLLENLSTKNFSSSLLKTSNIYTFLKEDLRFSHNDTILSSYVPENAFINEYSILNFKKNNPTLFLYNNFYGTLITATSAKKTSVQWIYMPIVN